MSETDPVVVVAVVTPEPGREDEVEQALSAAVAATHDQDEGCRLYAAHRTVRGRDGFTVIEKWTSAEALSAHASGAAFASLSKALDGLLVEPISATVLAPLPAGDDDLGRL